ncbi:hypothetical protein CC78DRAFT_540623 [Lojkania enalia]|uniref:Uncharacterized protein n=1 Tax=Lojkania enalia TaxID=147567 RepID=A0A9P4N7A6_9PLEO|nr:hypothetical protein CC78DRAFT_540623 [Didymosphaeria enalia]
MARILAINYCDRQEASRNRYCQKIRTPVAKESLAMDTPFFVQHAIYMQLESNGQPSLQYDVFDRVQLTSPSAYPKCYKVSSKKTLAPPLRPSLFPPYRLCGTLDPPLECTSKCMSPDPDEVPPPTPPPTPPPSPTTPRLLNAGVLD